MLDEKQREGRDPAGVPAHETIALKVVGPGKHFGFVIPHHAGFAAYRGTGPCDYVCGRCAAPLAIGVHRGLFRGFIFSCACGAMNAVEA